MLSVENMVLVVVVPLVGEQGKGEGGGVFGVFKNSQNL